MFNGQHRQKETGEKKEPGGNEARSEVKRKAEKMCYNEGGIKGKRKARRR